MGHFRLLLSPAYRRELWLAFLFAGASVASLAAPALRTADRQPPGPRVEDTPTTPPVTQEPRKSDVPARLLAPITWGGTEGKDYRLQLGGDQRIRFESRRNFDGILRTEDDDNFGAIRTRAHADLLYRDVVRAYLEVLDGRLVAPDYQYNQEASYNLQQAFLEFRNIQETSWSLRLGRQEMDLGRDRRLAEASGWNNLRRSYQGARALYESKEMDATLFVLNPLTFDRRRNGGIVSGRSHPNDDEFFYGGYATLRQWDPHTIETYFLGLSDRDNTRNLGETGTAGDSNRYTIGSVLYGPLWKDKEHGTLSYTMEGAYQFGNRSSDQIDAWMFRKNISYDWVHPWKPRVTLEGNLGSGDRRRGDGVNNTFNPLFGSSHSPYGVIDVVRLQNMRNLALYTRIDPTDRLRFQLELHGFWLDSRTDAWYDGGGRNLGRDPRGNAGRRLGEEIALISSYKWSEHLSTEVGAARFIPGPAAESFGKTGSANFFYVQSVFTF